MTKARAKLYWVTLKDEKNISVAEAAVLAEAMKILNRKLDDLPIWRQRFLQYSNRG